jgi:hypothetical protein
MGVDLSCTRTVDYPPRNKKKMLKNVKTVPTKVKCVER